MTSVALVAFTAVMLAALLITEKRGDTARRPIVKALTSFGFVALGILRFEGSSLDSWILAALVFGAVGDLLLAKKNTFDLGLLAFLVDHVLLMVAFHTVLSIRTWPPLFLVPFAAVGGVVLVWLWPRLGRRKSAVAVYVLAITVMVWGALSCAAVHALPWWIALAAALFMLSDIAVARQRFVTEDFSNRLIGLPMYYAAQILFALMIGH